MAGLAVVVIERSTCAELRQEHARSRRKALPPEQDKRNSPRSILIACSPSSKPSWSLNCATACSKLSPEAAAHPDSGLPVDTSLAGSGFGRDGRRRTDGGFGRQGLRGRSVGDAREHCDEFLRGRRHVADPAFQDLRCEHAADAVGRFVRTPVHAITVPSSATPANRPELRE